MRLIDVDAMNEELFYEQTGGKDTLITCEAAFDMIKAQPTVYDIDKVVAELERAKHEICLYGDDLEHYQNGIDEAIEIVKQGGVSDDVCEWRCDAYGRWHTECHTLADNDPLEYKYCPYCGKKIKEVE